MSLLRRVRRVGFRPGDRAGDLGRLPGSERLEVILSNHLVRYALLPWSAALSSDGEWLAYAQHVFATTYGADAAAWRIRVCGEGRRARVACAADADLLDALAAVERVTSIQPHLMAAFNARRKEFGREPGWLVLHEPGRLTVGLVAGGEWKLLRNRQAPEGWREALPDLLRREALAAGAAPCGRAVLAAEMAA